MTNDSFSGTVLNIYKNDQKICPSYAKYSVGGGHAHGRRAIEKRQGNGPSVDGKPHIREMTVCTMMGKVKPTDQIWIEAGKISLNYFLLYPFRVI